jgi:LmbE family N-acetylglucosaminyl deacetylase
MIPLSLNPKASAPQILCLGAHSDDIEIGCGGAILQIARQYPNAEFRWVVFSAAGVRAEEAQRSAALFLGSRLKGLVLKTFRDGFMPFEGAAVKDVFEELKGTTPPDLIFTHNRKDAHQDHRLLAELTWNTYRSHLILEYEIPKYDGDLGQPSVFMPIDRELCRQKVSHLMEVFSSQRPKHWFDEETFLALMRLRGMECGSASGYAEGFYCRKLVLG